MSAHHNCFATFQIAVLALVCGALAGCSSGDETNSASASRLKGLAKAYLDFAVARGAGPSNQAEFVRYLGTLPEGMMAAGIHSETPEQLLISDRDGQGYQIQFSIPAAQILRANVPLLARETVGKEGRCLAVYANGQVVCRKEPIPKEWQSHEN